MTAFSLETVSMPGSAYRINASGNIVCTIETLSAKAEAGHAFLWSGGRIIDLGTFDGESGFVNSSGYGINDFGLIVGTSGRSNSPNFHACLWDKGSLLDLGALKGYLHSIAKSINNSNQIVGSAYNAALDGHALLWIDGDRIDLGTLGGSGSTAETINASGGVVGFSETANNEIHASLWFEGEVRDLGTLGGCSSRAYGINSSFQIVGTSETSETKKGVDGKDYPISHAFLWDVQYGMQDLGALTGGHFSHAYAINDAGQIVGDSDGIATLWQNGKIYDLNALVAQPGEAQLSVARDINNSGKIVGTGSMANI